MTESHRNSDPDRQRRSCRTRQEALSLPISVAVIILIVAAWTYAGWVTASAFEDLVSPGGEPAEPEFTGRHSAAMWFFYRVGGYLGFTGITVVVVTAEALCGLWMLVRLRRLNSTEV